MWIDRTDATQLAQRLRVGPRELIETIGGPWRISPRVPERESERPGTLFVGRAGPSVALLVTDAADPDVVVGRAVGVWHGAHTLHWAISDIEGTFATPPAHSPAGDVDDLLADLGAAVEEAAAAARPELVLCRYCGRLVAPALAVGEQLCSGCGSDIFGIVY